MRTGLAAVALLLAACTGQAAVDDVPAPEPTPETWPDCADVWVVGERLPATFTVCLEPWGDFWHGDVRECRDGSALLMYRDMIAKPRGVIRDGGKMKPGGTVAYSALVECLGPRP